MTAQSTTAEFHALHHAGTPLLLPNAWDYASAAVLADAGFAAVGTTSLGVAVAHGLPDAHGVARDQTLALARLLGRLPCPVTVDIEAGFSQDPAEVADLARALHAAGAAGVNLEDGRADGTLADRGQQRTLLAAVKHGAPDLFLNARIDTYWLGVQDPPPLPETLARAEVYLEAGADGVFVPGAADAALVRTLVERIPAPLNILFQPGQHTFQELADLGVRRVSTGSLLFRGALHATVQTALAVRDGNPVPAGIPAYADIQQLTAEPPPS